jgi:hypothetical protein
MIAVMILVVGLIAMLSLFARALITVTFSEDDMIAKQKAREALESIYTARNTSQITFAMIGNVGGGGIFLSGPQPLRLPGTDGLVGTADDGALEVMTLPGPDGTLGTGDDEIKPLTKFTREIIVRAGPSSELKEVEVNIRFTTPSGLQRTYQVMSYVSRYR